MTATVVTVDDDRMFRGLLKDLLRRDSALAVIGEAENGIEGVHAATRLRPDIVVMDVTMPLMNGLEATRQIKAGCPATKVIVLTVHNEASYENAARENGADAFLAKKRLSSALLPTIHRLLQSAQGKKAAAESPTSGPPDFDPMKAL